MKKFYVEQEARYVRGTLIDGHRDGYIEADSEEAALDGLKNKGWDSYLETTVDEVVEEVNFDDMPFKITEVTDGERE